MQEIQSDQNAHRSNALSAQGSSSQISRGTWRGQTVLIQTSEKSLFASAAEEMSFTRAERKTDQLTKRKIKAQSRLDPELFDKALSYLRKTKEIDEGKDLQPLTKAIILEKAASGPEIRKLVDKQLTDPTLQFLAIVYAYNNLKTSKKNLGNAVERSGLQVNALESALEDLLQEHGSGIRASINTFETVHSFLGSASGGNDAQTGSFRRFYSDAVLDYGGLSVTFKRLVDQFGSQNFSNSVKCVLLALGADLAAEGPSMPKERLKMIVNDLYKLQSLECLNDECEELLQQLKRIFVAHTIPDKVQVIQAVLSLLGKPWLSTQKVQRIPSTLNLAEDMNIYFWRGFRELVRLLPQKSYDGPLERDKILSTIQLCLDLEIENEKASDH